MNHSHKSIQEFIRSLPSEDFKLLNPPIQLGVQVCRRSCIKRPKTVPDFTSGNFHFVYKNCALIEKMENSAKYLAELDDVIFSHIFFTETGPQWDLVFCAIAHLSDDYVCPICLFKPCVPILTRCGHIFCLDCMKKLFKSSEKHLCPVCYESMIESEIVRAKLIYHPDKNESITFTKVKRKLPFNVCTPWNVPQDRLLPSSDPCSIFTHFSIADDKFIEDVYSSELKEIEEQIKIYSEYDETDRIEILTKLKSSLHISPSGHKTAFALTQDTPEDKYVYFYQAADGRLLFPDDLTEKMLLKSFGSIQSAPNSFTAPILTRVTKTIDGTEKNNIFAHLPHGAEVQLALLDLNGIVSPEVIKRYHHLICSRVAPKSPKPKKQTHVITKDDYQTFIPLPQEPQVDLQSEKEFPKFEGISNQLKPKNNNVAKYDLKDEFPAIGQPKPKKPINTSSYSKLKFNTTDEGNLDLKSNYPTLKSTGNTAVKKKQSAWSNLKL